jgi:hypothetical protein
MLGGRLADRPASTFNDEQMGSTPFGDADPAHATGSATPQKLEFQRGDRGRVGADGCA